MFFKSRQLLGEDLGPLNVKELQNLEKQLEGALAQARQRKVIECDNVKLTSYELIKYNSTLRYFIHSGCSWL